MSVAGGIVLYAVTWFVTMLVVLPIRLRTQGDAGQVAPGTPESAPADFRLGRTMLIVTVAGTLVWAAIAAVIVWGGIGIADFDWFTRFGPGSAP